MALEHLKCEQHSQEIILHLFNISNLIFNLKGYMWLMAMILDKTAIESIYEYSTAQVQNFSFPVVYEV